MHHREMKIRRRRCVFKVFQWKVPRLKITQISCQWHALFACCHRKIWRDISVSWESYHAKMQHFVMVILNCVTTAWHWRDNWDVFGMPLALCQIWPPWQDDKSLTRAYHHREQYFLQSGAQLSFFSCLVCKGAYTQNQTACMQPNRSVLFFFWNDYPSFRFFAIFVKIFDRSYEMAKREGEEQELIRSSHLGGIDRFRSKKKSSR